MSAAFYFPGVTLLITHYNRSSSLERLLAAFKVLNCRFEEIVVSDDGSKPEQLERVMAMQSLYDFRLITSPKNRGFPNNLNKGQDAVKTPYTLYIQEDFVPTTGFPPHLQDALQFMTEDSKHDYIRFWSFYRYPNLKPYGKGFSEIVFSPWNMSHLKFFMYSDNPHLRRSNFLQKFGRYKEDEKGDIAEYKMAVSFLQKKGNGLFYDEYSTLFEHKNSPDEPSTQGRADWRQSRNIFFLFVRWLYLRFKWMKSTWDMKFMRL
jgi:glycosyltransferase involved in cell wall biosynthesis